MKINPVSTNEYRKEQLRYAAKNAALSSAASAGVTLIINKGKPAFALKIGAIAAAISVVIDMIHGVLNKPAKPKDDVYYEQGSKTKINCHQG